MRLDGNRFADNMRETDMPRQQTQMKLHVHDRKEFTNTTSGTQGKRIVDMLVSLPARLITETLGQKLVGFVPVPLVSVQQIGAQEDIGASRNQCPGR